MTEVYYWLLSKLVSYLLLVEFLGTVIHRIIASYSFETSLVFPAQFVQTILLNGTFAADTSLQHPLDQFRWRQCVLWNVITFIHYTVQKLKSKQAVI
jgi:hypothetical protein